MWDSTPDRTRGWLSTRPSSIIRKAYGSECGISKKNLGRVATKDGRIRLHAPEVADWIKEIHPEKEEKRLKMDAKFPLILMAGRHMDMNANTAMRNPEWNKGRRPCTLAINPADAQALGIVDTQMVKVITEAGEETIEAEVSTDTRKGQVLIPQGFGLVYDGVKYGVNINSLTKNTNRDFVGTPMHRYVPCRVEVFFCRINDLKWGKHSRP